MSNSTVGERIAKKHVPNLPFVQVWLVPAIDRAIRRAQAIAWDAGYESCRDSDPKGYDANPYRRTKK